MGTRKSNPGRERKPDTQRFLTAAEYFLRSRNFADSHKYALRAQQSDPTDPDPTRIISIASVLSVPTITPTQPDYYTILHLPRFESDPTRIHSSFNKLTATLNPKTNPYPFSSESYDVVLKAWSVLSNPIVKARFDEALRIVLGDTLFWTVCPYCYHVYEYDKVYEECVLRCANVSCRRGFHAVSIAPPPLEAVERGSYCCPGFVPFALSSDDVNRNDCGNVVDDDVSDHGYGKKTKIGFGNSGNGGFANANVVNVQSMMVSNCGDVHINVDENECLEMEDGGETSNGVESGVEFF